MAATIKVTAIAAPNAQAGTTYTFALGDEVTGVTLNNGLAITATVPPNSSVAFPVGAQILLIGTGAGQVTIAAGSGVTVNSPSGMFKLRVQYSPATLWKVATDTWQLLGDLSA